MGIWIMRMLHRPRRKSTAATRALSFGATLRDRPRTSPGRADLLAAAGISPRAIVPRPRSIAALTTHFRPELRGTADASPSVRRTVMPAFHRILCATDFSATSLEALDLALS